MSKIAVEDNFSMCRKAQFRICDSCFWCASILDDSMTADTCPLCKSTMFESIPIASDESYRFDHNMKSGVMLEFIAD